MGLQTCEVLQKKYHRSNACFLLFYAVLSLVLPSSLCSSPNEADGSVMLSKNELAQLIEISTRLGTLNETLKNELEGSKQNSAELETTLETSKNEVEMLKNELDALQTTSIALESSVENSEKVLSGLKTALSKADASLASLELSFKAYKGEAERQIQRLERSGRFFKIALLSVSCICLGSWAAFALVR